MFLAKLCVIILITALWDCKVNSDKITSKFNQLSVCVSYTNSVFNTKMFLMSFQCVASCTVTEDCVAISVEKDENANKFTCHMFSQLTLDHACSTETSVYQKV